MELTPFTFDGNAVRVITDEHGEPRFVASDVAKILGYRDAEKMTRRLPVEDRGTRSVGTPGGEQDMTVITEPGLYIAIFGSQVEGAERFKRWIATEVLPAIRKTGGYQVAAALPQDFPSALRALADTAESLAAEQAARAIEAPKAQAWEDFLSANGDYSVNQSAKVLSRRAGTIIGETRLWKWLAEHKWTYRDHSGQRAYQKRIDTGHLVEKSHAPYTDPHTGEEKVRGVQVRITPKGLERLDRGLSGQFELDIEGVA
ncbi:phage antirepressor KilAC domain-containing protein [Promicromonospora vindobonensis]|uniref:Phage antirepressor KilAC domain-containing protein n=1 Tax=Promicromonospora vindobonensis TaxID=195748 RepID=A0ABW5VLQ2_9MICO